MIHLFISSTMTNLFISGPMTHLFTSGPMNHLFTNYNNFNPIKTWSPINYYHYHYVCDNTYHYIYDYKIYQSPVICPFSTNRVYFWSFIPTSTRPKRFSETQHIHYQQYHSIFSNMLYSSKPFCKQNLNSTCSY